MTALAKIGSYLLQNKAKLAIGGLVTGLCSLPELPKIEQAKAQGDGTKQVLGSIVNVAKWMAIPALAVSIFNPVTVAGAAAVGLAGFVLPSYLPDINLAEGKEQGDTGKQGVSYLT